MFVAVAVVLSGCATPRPFDVLAESRTAVSSIEVRVGDFAPATTAARDASPEKQAVAGTAAGAAGGVAGTVAIAPLCATPYTAAVCAVLLPVFGVLAVSGGAVGAEYGKSAGGMQLQAQQAIASAMPGEATQHMLVDSIVEYGGTYSGRRFVQAGTSVASADAILEVALLRADALPIQAGTWGIVSTHYAVSLEARARLKRLSDGMLLADRTYRYDTVPRTPQEWTANGGTPLAVEISRGYGQLAEWIVDEFFLNIGELPQIGHVQSPSDNAFGRDIAQAGVPEMPPIPRPTAVVPHYEKHFWCDKGCTLAKFVPVPVETTRPTLGWSFDTQALTSALAARHGFGEPLRAESVRYEVRVFRGETRPLHPRSELVLAGSPIYVRSGLRGTSHVVEEELAACTNYLWTVRAVFDLGEWRQATEWAGEYRSHEMPHHLRAAGTSPGIFGARPADYGYPFSTPCTGKAGQAAKEDNM